MLGGARVAVVQYWMGVGGTMLVGWLCAGLEWAWVRAR